jgi:hypothetical protein
VRARRRALNVSFRAQVQAIQAQLNQEFADRKRERAAAKENSKNKGSSS